MVAYNFQARFAAAVASGQKRQTIRAPRKGNGHAKPGDRLQLYTAAIIPPRKNAQLWKPSTAGARARNEAVRACKYLGRALWRKLTGYHRRSCAETKMHCVKRLGQGLMARDFHRQVAELQIRIAVLNRYTALGIPITQPVG